MSTPTDSPSVAPAASAPSQMPADVGTLQNILKSVVAKLMAHSQTVQELIKANMELRAALHLAEQDKGQLEDYIQSLLNPTPMAAPQTPVNEAPATDTSDADTDADSVSP